MDFWVSIGSTYSYLTVMRIEDEARARGIDLRWRPFNVRHVMVTQNNVPFRDKPVKAAYMWRDIERRAQRYGMQPKIPAPYPLKDLVLANQVALVGAEEGWVASYVKAAYKLWFEEGHPAGEVHNLVASLAGIGQDPDRVVSEARSPRIERKLQEETEEAMALGVFGAPSFVVDGEVFWGDDRLEDALSWSQDRPKS